MTYFDDVAVGVRRELGAFRFTSEAIRAFAVQYDPQPFHVDETLAARSHFGGLVASGWHVAAIWMRLNVKAREEDRLAAERAGRTAPVIGPSPGFRNMVWRKPVRPGDELFFFSEATGKKTQVSRPDWGVVLMRNGALDKAGEEVFAFDGAVFWKRRPIP